MKKSMFFRRFGMTCVVLLLCVLPVSAFEGPGFTIDIPENWVKAQEVDDVSYNWLNTEETLELIVTISDNEDQRNPFDIWEEDMEELEEAFAEMNMTNEYAKSMEDGFRQQGIDCTVESITTDFSLCEWGDGQPALVVEGSFHIDFVDESAGMPYYLHMAVLSGKEHNFTIACISADETSIAAVQNDGILDTFRITEAVYDGPTDTKALWGDVIFSVGVTMLCAVVALSGALGVYRKRKKKTVDMTEHL